jgi:hypothetical protein
MAGRDFAEFQYSADAAAEELTRSGVARAGAAVRGYLDRLSAEAGVSVHQWGLDDGDLAAIEAASGRAR